MPPEEWDTFVEVLRTPLPAAFRINSRYAVIPSVYELLNVNGRKYVEIIN